MVCVFFLFYSPHKKVMAGLRPPLVATTLFPRAAEEIGHSLVCRPGLPLECDEDSVSTRATTGNFFFT